MSFINLIINDIWSDADITARTEAMVRSVISLQDELVLNRKIQGANLGQYTLSTEDQVQMALLAQAGFTAQQEGIAARNDMALLLKVLDYEKAKSRLSLPIIEPVLDEENNILNQEKIDIDIQERDSVQSIIDNADQEIVDLYNLRNPVIEFPEEVTPEETIILEDI